MAEPITLTDEQVVVENPEDELLDALVRRGTTGGRIRLNREDEEKLIQRVVMDINDGVAANTTFRANHLQFMRLWRSILEPKDFPFVGAANIEVPFTPNAVETHLSRFYKALFGGDRVGIFTALDPGIDDETLEQINGWFHWELRETVKLKQAFREFGHDTLIDGFSLVIPSYERERGFVRDERDVPIQQGIPLERQLQMALAELFPGELAITGSPALGVYDVETVNEAGERVPAHVAFRIERDRIIAAVDREKILFDGVRLETVDLENLVIINSSHTVEGLPSFNLRIWYSTETFDKKVADGEFMDLGTEEMDRIRKTAQVKTAEVVPQEWTQELDAEEGGDSTDSQASSLLPERRWVEVYRSERRWDVQGENIGIAVWIAARSRRIIRLERLDTLNPNGERSPIKFDWIVQPRRFYSIGVPEWLQHTQQELDLIHNTRVNGGLIASVPFFFYSKSAGLQDNVLHVEPGVGIQVKDPNAISWPRLNFDMRWGMNEEAVVRRYGLEQAGLSESATGSFISKRQSASEFLGTSQSTDIRTEYALDGFGDALTKLLWRIFHLYQRHMPEGRVFQVTGINGERLVQKMSREPLQGKLHLELTANVQQLSAQLQRDVSLNMLQLFMSPIFLQLGISKPATLHQALARVMRSMEYTGVPIYSPEVMPDSEPPSVEIRKMLLGEAVQPSPGENFAMHLTAHLRTATDPTFLRTAPPQAQQLLAQHIQATQQMQQQVAMLKNMQAQQALVSQGQMEKMGIRPGQAGGQTAGQQARPATAEEGAPGAAGEQEAA